jgi:hypothetical protein
MILGVPMISLPKLTDKQKILQETRIAKEKAKALEEKRLAEEKTKHAEHSNSLALAFSSNALAFSSNSLALAFSSNSLALAFSSNLEEKAKALEEKNKPWYKF